jgi:DNA-directed RNA polymerase specialized sigma24 family protein
MDRQDIHEDRIDRMTETESVTGFLDGLKRGDQEDIRGIWDRYFERLVRLVGTRLPRHRLRAFDAEDVALSAFHSFCAAAGRGQFPRLEDRDDLWKLLSTIAARKAAAQMRHQNRDKRGGGRVLGESAFIGRGQEADEGIARLLDRGPTPDEIAAFLEGYERLLGTLTEPTLRSVAVLRLEGHSIEEIAAALEMAPRTVDRKLRVIRALWEREGLG